MIEVYFNVQWPVDDLELGLCLDRLEKYAGARIMVVRDGKSVPRDGLPFEDSAYSDNLLVLPEYVGIVVFPQTWMKNFFLPKIPELKLELDRVYLNINTHEETNGVLISVMCHPWTPLFKAEKSNPVFHRQNIILE